MRGLKRPNNNNANTRFQPRGSYNAPPRINIAGGVFQPSDEPPVITGSPWNSVTLETMIDVSSKSTDVTVETVLTVMQNQLGFAGKSVAFEFRPIAISTWFYPIDDSAMKNTNNMNMRCAMFPMNLSVGQNTVELTRVDSHTMRNKFGKCGYKYPITQSSVPISTTDAKKSIIVKLFCSIPGSVFLHFKILWRGASQGFQVFEYNNSLLNYYVPLRQVRTSENDDTDFDVVSNRSDIVDDEEDLVVTELVKSIQVKDKLKKKEEVK